MKEIYGNFFDVAKDNKYTVLVCTTNRIVKRNGELVMGGGIAKDFADRYPELPLEFGQQTRNGIWLTAHYSFTDEKWLLGFTTKEHYANDSTMELILRSTKELVKWVNETYHKHVLMTRPGCGLGNLHWPTVKAAIAPLLDDRFYIIEKFAPKQQTMDENYFCSKDYRLSASGLSADFNKYYHYSDGSG